MFDPAFLALDVAVFLVHLGGLGKTGLLFVLPLVVSISFLLIADIDSPRGGVIHVNPQNLNKAIGDLRQGRSAGNLLAAVSTSQSHPSGGKSSGLEQANGPLFATATG